MSRIERRWPALLVLLACLAATPASALKLTGRVIDADSRAPIADAEIELANVSGGQGFFRARTSRAGEFSIDRIASDRYYALTVSAAHYADFVLGSWQFPATQQTASVVIPLDRAGVLEVKVTRGDGKSAVPSARVAIQREQGSRWWEAFRPPPAPVFTDAGGLARFDGLQSGTWTVNVDAPGLLPNEARRVTVRRGETTKVPLTLVKGAGIEGTVRLADGTGIAGINVIARGPAEAVATTGTDGAFALGDLPPGNYRLETAHEGFEVARTRGAVTVREGDRREELALSVKPKAPEVALVLEREAFVPGTKLQVRLRAFRVGAVDFALYQIPVTRLLDPANDFRLLATSRDSAGITRVRSWTHPTTEGPPYAWREELVDLPTDLESGAYLLSGRSGTVEKRTIFFVTNLGLLVKRSPRSLMVAAASLGDGRPVPGALLYTTTGPIKAPAGEAWTQAMAGLREPRASTAADGVVEIPIDRAGQLRVIAVSASHGVSIAETQLAPAADAGGDKVFLYTDRPIYRPGHIVYWKAFGRRATDSEYTMPDATKAVLTFRSPDGSTLPVADVPLSRWGTADGAITLPSEVALGDWTLQAQIGRASATTSLAVQEYRKPEFSVDVQPDREVYVSGDEVRFRVAATYFFGAPVFGAAVRYNLFESRLASDLDFEGEEFETPAGYGRVLKTGETRTDIDGRVSIAFDPPRVAYDRRLTLEVEVVDASNRVVSGRGSTIVGRGLFTVRITPTSRLVMVGAPIPIEIQTRDHTGKPVSASVTVELDQDAWNPIERRTTRSTRPLASATVTTNAEGRATLELRPSPARSGSLQIRARAEDSKGNRIASEASLWVYDPRTVDYAYRYPTLEAFADRDRYQPGDTARILINTEVRGARVLATVEGRQVLERRSLTLTGNTGLLEVPIRAEHAPNVFVAIHVWKGRELHSRVIELPVVATRHDLAITLAPDREEYKPGETARVGITTKDATGRPVPAELSLGVVDEAIYGLRPDLTPDPHDVFYGRRPNWVTTSVSFPVIYYAGADKGKEEQVRRDFRDVAHWAPAIITDAQGRAEVSFSWPDNLTTWRLTSRGATEDTRVGKAVAKVLVSKPLVARIAAPRTVVAGDRVTLLGMLDNRGRTPLTGIDATLEVKGPAKIVGKPGRRSDLPAGGQGRNEWEVEFAPEAPPVDAAAVALTLRARAPAEADALEITVPVKARAVALGSRGAGVVEGAAARVAVPLPNDLVRPGSEVRIDLSPSIAAMALRGAEYLIDYPWACTEQTANAVIPAAALISATRKAKLALPGWDDPIRRFSPFLRRLVATQLPEGGWAWWERGEADPFLTALALDALARGHQLGLGGGDVENAINRGANGMSRLLSEVRTLDGEAYVLHHLTPLLALPDAASRFGPLKSDLEALAVGLHAQRHKLGTSGLALAARALAALERVAEAKALLELLRSRAVSDGAGVHWPADAGEDGWFGEEIENTAYALSAMIAIAPDDRRVDDVVRWLAGNRRGGYWRSTRTTGPVTTALAEYLSAHAGELAPDYDVKVDWNGQTVLERKITAADLFGGAATTVTVKGASLKPGENRLAFTKNGRGSLFWAWNARSLVPSPGPSTVIEKRLTVTREYLRAERVADRRGRPRYLVTPLAAAEPIKVGESIMVRLTLRASRRLSYLMIEDPRPAGFEVDRLLPDGADWPWSAHAEERDDRNVFFVTEIEAGETVIESLIRPELAGGFTALPTAASAMYDPSLEVRSGEARLTVAP